MHTHTPPLGPLASRYQSQSQAWNSPRVRKAGSSEWAQILLPQFSVDLELDMNKST